MSPGLYRSFVNSDVGECRGGVQSGAAGGVSLLPAGGLGVGDGVGVASASSKPALNEWGGLENGGWPRA